MEMTLDFSAKLAQAVQENLPFALLRKPEENQVFLYVQDDTAQQKISFHSFDSAIERSISDQNPAVISSKEFDFDFELKLTETVDGGGLTQMEYEKIIQNTVAEIQQSNTRKVVMSRRKVQENLSYHVLKSYRNLMEQQPNALVFLWHYPEKETWLGATPELLLSQKGNQLNTVSLAATKLPSASWMEKEFDEQQIVTDFILDCFKGTENLQSIGPETVQAGKFQHLKTYISAEIPENFTIENLLKKLHPTPALCGLPKKAAFDYIVEHEGYDREFYAGYIGIQTKNSKTYFVNLRSAQLFSNQIWVYVGGGITAESVPEKEWMETELKSGTILNALER